MAFLLRKVISGFSDPSPRETCDYYDLPPSRVDRTCDIVEDSAADCPGPSPQRFLVHQLPPTARGKLRIVVLSDTHELHRLLHVPNGDILLHGGDILMADRLSLAPFSQHRIEKFLKWLNRLPHPCKVFIGGNHDEQLEKLGPAEVKALAHPALYLHNEAVEVHLATVNTAAAAPAVSVGRTAVVGGEEQLKELPHAEPAPSLLFLDKVSPVTGGSRLPRTPSPASVGQPTVSKSPPQVVRVFGTPWSFPNTSLSPNTAFQQQLTDVATLVPDDLPPGNVDILLCHHCAPCAGLSQLVQRLRPLIAVVGGHVHERHGLFSLHGVPCINGSMMVGAYGRETLLRPVVVDVLLPDASWRRSL